MEKTIGFFLFDNFIVELEELEQNNATSAKEELYEYYKSKGY